MRHRPRPATEVYVLLTSSVQFILSFLAITLVGWTSRMVAIRKTNGKFRRGTPRVTPGKEQAAVSSRNQPALGRGVAEISARQPPFSVLESTLRAAVQLWQLCGGTDSRCRKYGSRSVPFRNTDSAPGRTDRNSPAPWRSAPGRTIETCAPTL